MLLVFVKLLVVELLFKIEVVAVDKAWHGMILQQRPGSFLFSGPGKSVHSWFEVARGEVVVQYNYGQLPGNQLFKA